MAKRENSTGIFYNIGYKGTMERKEKQKTRNQ